MNQRGFATLEVILMVVVIGILASMAMPRFTNVTTRANTAKIQADLSTINTAIEIYYMEKGSYPSKIKEDLVDNNYLQAVPQPTSGSVYEKGEVKTISSGADYAIDSNKNQATFGGKTIDEYYAPKSSTTTTGT